MNNVISFYIVPKIIRKFSLNVQKKISLDKQKSSYLKVKNFSHFELWNHLLNHFKRCVSHRVIIKLGFQYKNKFK